MPAGTCRTYVAPLPHAWLGYASACYTAGLFNAYCFDTRCLLRPLLVLLPCYALLGAAACMSTCLVLLLCYVPAWCCCFAMHLLGAATLLCTCLLLLLACAPLWCCRLAMHLRGAVACMCTYLVLLLVCALAQRSRY